jgi:ubiquinone/menaquinone biosynthesis C-methylase UbiE
MTGQVSPRSAQVAALFDRVSGVYDSVGVPWFTPIADRLVAELAPAAGEHALDVGCGRGAVTFGLARAVGQSGHVTGLDLAPGMIERLTADVAQRGLPQVDLHLMDASAPALPAASFDLLAASLVLFFLPDPAGALASWLELLKPGGRIGISTFGPQDENWVAVDEVFTPFLPQQMLDARTSGRVGPFASDDGVESLMVAAGFAEPRTVTMEVPVTFRDAEQWREWTFSHGMRGMWDAVPDDSRAEVLARAAGLLEQARDAGGPITLVQQVRYTLARRP